MLKFEASFTRGVRQCFDFAMVTGAATVENNGVDAFADRSLRSQRSNCLGANGIGRQFVAVGHRFAGCGSGGNCRASDVVNELDVNVFVSKANAHARTLFSAANLVPDTPVAELCKLMFLFGSHQERFVILYVSRFTHHWTVLPSLRTTRSSL